MPFEEKQGRPPGFLQNVKPDPDKDDVLNNVNTGFSGLLLPSTIDSGEFHFFKDRT